MTAIAPDEASLLALLSAPPAAGLAPALRRIRPGLLWDILLPGVSRAGMLHHLGPAAPAILATSLGVMGNLEGALWDAGLPFAFEAPCPALLAAYLLAPVEPAAAAPLRSAEQWRDLALLAVDATAAALLAGHAVDSLDAMAHLDGVDLRDALGVADAAARQRLAAGLADAGNLGAFEQSHLRWSTAAGLLRQIEKRVSDSAAGMAARMAHGALPLVASDAAATLGPVMVELGPAADFALAVAPMAAQQMVPGWPVDAWLLVIVAGETRWDVALSADVGDVLAGLPTWPPLPGQAIASLPAEQEIELLRRIAAEPGIARTAHARISFVSAFGQEIAASDLDW